VVSGLFANGNNKSYREQIKLIDDAGTTGIARLWARNKVEEMTDDLMLGGELLKERSLIWLTIQLQSLSSPPVAVDRNPDASRMANAKAKRRRTHSKRYFLWVWLALELID
jgi:hypothetical protein